MKEAVGFSSDAGSLPRKLYGRAFYESIGSPKVIVAPMVDRSEFAWRMLTRSYMDEHSSKSLLAYTPMLHARLFSEAPKFRDAHFQPIRSSLTSKAHSSSTAWLDGNPAIDRPLVVQFCANKPEDLLEAAQYVAPYCDAVDLNLGCPQGIARSGHYGAFLQEDWDTIHSLINKLHTELPVPVTAKMRVLETKEKTLDYAKMILSAGASILTVHGRRREQKGQNMGVADWQMIRYLRDNLPADTVIFANGNILNRNDLQPCLDATGADGIMSAEGNLSDPTIFARPPQDAQNREYWRGNNGQEGYRIDGVMRRYLDVVYKYVLETDPPQRPPLYVPTDASMQTNPHDAKTFDDQDEPPKKKQKQYQASKTVSPSLKFMQGHLFQMFRPFIATHIHIRDALSKCRPGDMPAFERVLSLLEEGTREALQADVNQEVPEALEGEVLEKQNDITGVASSRATIAKYKRPWFICQPHIRPLPEEAIAKGALQMSKKEKAKIEKEQREIEDPIRRSDDDRIHTGQMANAGNDELPRSAILCG